MVEVGIVETMRVALLTAANSWSGAEVHTINLARALRERGHDVVIVELGRRGYAEASHIIPCPVIHVDLGPDTLQRSPLESLGFRSWQRILGALQADIAISVKGMFKFASLAMEAACRLQFRSYLVIEHMQPILPELKTRRHFGGLVPGLGLWWYRQKFSGYLRSIFPHRVICVSHAVASTLQNDYGYPPSKLVVWHIVG